MASVKFKGYDESYNLFQPVSELVETAPESVSAYLTEHGLTVAPRIQRLLRDHLPKPDGDVPS